MPSETSMVMFWQYIYKTILIADIQEMRIEARYVGLSQNLCATVNEGHQKKVYFVEVNAVHCIISSCVTVTTNGIEPTAIPRIHVRTSSLNVCTGHVS
jgi:hypothetical protein